MNTERTVQKIAEATMPTHFGLFHMTVFQAQSRLEHVALTSGNICADTPTLVRLHSECMTGDVFSSARCDCGEQLDASLQILQREGGVLLYLRQEGRGIGLVNKIRAYALQDQGLDTVDANRALGLPDDMRDYGEAAEMLGILGIRHINLLTNNPAKVEGLERHGIRVEQRIPLVISPNPQNVQYLITKQRRMGHQLPELLVHGQLAS